MLQGNLVSKMSFPYEIQDEKFNPTFEKKLLLGVLGLSKNTVCCLWMSPNKQIFRNKISIMVSY